MALNLFALSKSDGRSAGDRYACLLTAHGVMTALIHDRVNLPRLLTHCRVLSDLGKREAAVSVLNQICRVLKADGAASLDEPFCALTDDFFQADPGNKLAEWLVAMVLMQREDLRAFSDFFTRQESLSILQEVQATGFTNEGIDRRIQLIQKRFDIV